MNKRRPFLRALMALLLVACHTAAQAEEAPELAAAKRTFVGRVLDEHGEPLGGVAVCAVPIASDWLPEQLATAATTHTDERGAFELEVLDRRIEHALFVTKGRAYVMQSLDLLQVWPVQLAKAGAFAGVVRTKGGEPIEGVRISAADYLRDLPMVRARARGNTQAWLSSVAVTDARGHFLLRGVYDTAIRLQVSKLGFEELLVEPVSKFDPLTLELDPVAIVTGVVLDPTGSPVAGAAVEQQLAGARYADRQVRTDEQGRFACNWLGATMRLSVRHPSDSGHMSGSCELESAGACEIQLRQWPDLAPPKPPTRQSRVAQPEQKVVVHAVMPNGEPCADYRVAVFQVDPRQQRFRGDAKQLELFADSATYGVDGEATALVYVGNHQGALLVLATAEGCAMSRQVVDGDAKEVNIAFAPAAPIVGTVVDALTNKPVAGVRVWFLLQLDGMRNNRRKVPEMAGDGFVVVTDDDGKFALVDAPLGTGEVFFAAEGYAMGRQEYEVAKDAPPLAIVLKPLRSVVGQLSRLPFPRQCVGAMLHDSDDQPNGSAFFDVTGVQPFTAAGMVEFARQDGGAVPVDLVVQRMPRQGRPDRVDLGKLDIDPETKQLKLDASLAVPVIVRGRVSANVPRQRLAVLCAPMPAQSMYYAFLQYQGPLCPVAIDGTYELQAMPGERTLAVIDIVTGVMFAREKVKVVAEQPLQHEFRFEATAVTVRVHVAKENEKPAAGWFAEFVPGEDYWPSGLGQISVGSDRIEKYCRGMGVPVPVSAGYATMWLPPTSGWLALREFSSFSSARTKGEPRSERALDVGKDHDVTLNW
jgi:uncharacterized GH25 family protein